MATSAHAGVRLYVQNAAAQYDPATERGAWDSTASYTAANLAPTKSGAITTKAVAETSATLDYDVLILKAVSEPIPTAQTIGGTMYWTLGSLESDAAMNAHWHVHVYVTQGDSDTIRGTLYTDYTEAAGTNEFPTTAVGDTPVNSITLSSVDVSANDRIVIEIGYSSRNSSTTSYTGTLWYGGTNSIDLGPGGDETARPGYFEFPDVEWASATEIYRSVGTNTAALCIGTSGGGNNLAISGSTATFANDLSTSVGVGDAIQYDADNNGSIDAICFIHGRTSATSYTVKNVSGGTPTATSANDQDWGLYRSYVSLGKAESGDENDSISDTVEAFESWSGGHDLVTNNLIWNIACYGDGTDTSARVQFLGWTTGYNTYLKIFTPVTSSEVGTSQRHNGTFPSSGAYVLQSTDTGCIRNDGDSGFFWLDGLAFYANQVASEISIFITSVDTVSPSTDVIKVSNCIFKGDGSTGAGNYDNAFVTGGSGTGGGVVYLWNNIFYDWDAADSTAGCIIGDNTAYTLYIFNNTFHNSYYGINTAGQTMIAKNNIVQNCTDGFNGTFSASDYNISDIAADAPGPNSKNSTNVVFYNEDGDDFRLHAADTAARDAGTELSSDLTLSVATDIQGENRPQNSVTDIGADEFIDYRVEQSAGTRFYLRNEAAFYDPSTERGAWDSTASYSGIRLSPEKYGAIASKGVAETSSTNDYDVLLLKAVSDPIPTSQTITGGLYWTIGSLESSASLNAHWHIHVFVTQGDSDNVRGTLYTDYTEAAGVNEWPTTAVGDQPVGRITLSDVAVTAGDRIVIEIGYTGRNTSTTSYTGTVWYGGTSNSDLAPAGDETAIPGYFEFSGLTWAQKSIYRSVSSRTTALETGASNSLTISGTTATLASDLTTGVGVGNAIEYDADDNGTIDAIAFIHGRTSATSFTVRSASGETPVQPVASDLNWSIFHPYTSLANAESATENTNITSGVRDFDTWTGGRDVVTNREVWKMACFAGPSADSTLTVVDGWTTAFNQYLKIYTPTDSGEVGTSQRHAGKWTTNGAHYLQVSNDNVLKIDGNANRVDVDGIQTYNPAVNGNKEGGIHYYHDGTGAAMYVSNCILRGINAATGQAWHNGVSIASGDTGAGDLYVWNCIAYDFDTDGSTDNTGFYVNDSEHRAYFYNNTCFNSSVGFHQAGGGGPIAVAKNNISQDCPDGFRGTFTASDYNVSDIASDAPGPNSKNSTSVTFVDEANDDFHLDAADTGANDSGFDLSTDLTLSVTTDIDGESRPMNSLMDIGADEVTIGGSSRRIFLISSATLSRFLASIQTNFPSAPSWLAQYAESDWRKSLLRKRME